MSLYSRRGVSAQKEEVHAATRDLETGLYPHSFCKLYPDAWAGDDEWASIMHADGAGTKSILAYLYWKETGDLDVWRGIAQDAIVMNLDDLLCVGIWDRIAFSSTIDRNKNRIPGEVLKAIIEGSQEFFGIMEQYGIHITYMGGETADVGDLVRTIAVNGTMAARWERRKLVTNDRIAPGQVIVGLSSFGQAVYEKDYNSGIASNGLTSARHDLLHSYYRENFPESVEPSLEEQVSYIGKHHLTDEIDYEYKGKRTSTSIGKLILSPTRTFAPVIKQILTEHFEDVRGMIHSSGGGQTKCLKYLPGPMRVVKDNLFDPPVIFDLAREASRADDREMYQVYNMGTRMEIFTGERAATKMIAIANSLGVEAQVIGRVEASGKKELTITNHAGTLQF
jgi:phosphoribosylformylglycinamidine cyclo-ligase